MIAAGEGITTRAGGNVSHADQRAQNDPTVPPEPSSDVTALDRPRFLFQHSESFTFLQAFGEAGWRFAPGIMRLFYAEPPAETGLRREWLQGQLTPLVAQLRQPTVLGVREAHELIGRIEVYFIPYDEPPTMGAGTRNALYMWYLRAKFAVLGYAFGALSSAQHTERIAPALLAQWEDLVNAELPPSALLSRRGLITLVRHHPGLLAGFETFLRLDPDLFAEYRSTGEGLEGARMESLGAYVDFLHNELGLTIPDAAVQQILSEQGAAGGIEKAARRNFLLQSTARNNRIALDDFLTLAGVQRTIVPFPYLRGMRWSSRVHVAQVIADAMETTPPRGPGSGRFPALGGSSAPTDQDTPPTAARESSFAGFAESTEEAAEAEGTLPTWLLEEDASLHPADAAAEGGALLLQGGPALAPAGSAARLAAH